MSLPCAECALGAALDAQTFTGEAKKFGVDIGPDIDEAIEKLIDETLAVAKKHGGGKVKGCTGKKCPFDTPSSGDIVGNQSHDKLGAYNLGPAEEDTVKELVTLKPSGSFVHELIGQAIGKGIDAIAVPYLNTAVTPAGGFVSVKGLAPILALLGGWLMSNRSYKGKAFLEPALVFVAVNGGVNTYLGNYLPAQGGLRRGISNQIAPPSQFTRVPFSFNK